MKSGRLWIFYDFSIFLESVIKKILLFGGFFWHEKTNKNPKKNTYGMGIFQKRAIPSDGGRWSNSASGSRAFLRLQRLRGHAAMAAPGATRRKWYGQVLIAWDPKTRTIMTGGKSFGVFFFAKYVKKCQYAKVRWNSKKNVWKFKFRLWICIFQIRSSFLILEATPNPNSGHRIWKIGTPIGDMMKK